MAVARRTRVDRSERYGGTVLPPTGCEGRQHGHKLRMSEIVVAVLLTRKLLIKFPQAAGKFLHSSPYY